MFTCDVTNTPPNARNFVYSELLLVRKRWRFHWVQSERRLCRVRIEKSSYVISTVVYGLSKICINWYMQCTINVYHNMIL